MHALIARDHARAWPSTVTSPKVALDRLCTSPAGRNAIHGPLEKATETAKEHALGFPVGYALPLTDTAATLGAFYEDKRRFFQATGFVVKPDRTIAVSQYSSGPIGRLVGQDVVGLVQFYKKQAK